MTIATTGMGKFSQSTLADADVETDGKITALVRASKFNPASYSVGSSYQAEVVIKDNDHAGLPVLSVIGGGDIVEGDNAYFTIRADKHVTTDIPIRILVSQVGNFILDGSEGATSSTYDSGSDTWTHTDNTIVWTGIHNITLKGSAVNNSFSSQSNFHIFHLPTHYDFEIEPNGSISVAILSDTNVSPKYSVGADSRATVVVNDDDSGDNNNNNNDNNNDNGNSLPSVGVFSNFVQTGVSIHKPFNFTVYTTRPVENDLVVTVQVTANTDESTPSFFIGTRLSDTLILDITIPRGSQRVNYKVNNIIYCDDCIENINNNGRYSVDISARPQSYQILSNFSRVGIPVKTNDPTDSTVPIISIMEDSTNPDTVSGGDTVKVKLSSDRMINTDVHYRVYFDKLYDQSVYQNLSVGTSDVVDNGKVVVRDFHQYQKGKVTFSDNIAPYEYSIDITTPEFTQLGFDRRLMVQLVDGNGYVLSGRSSLPEVKIDIKNNYIILTQPAFQVAISAVDEYAYEGDFGLFVLSAIAPNNTETLKKKISIATNITPARVGSLTTTFFEIDLELSDTTNSAYSFIALPISKDDGAPFESNARFNATILNPDGETISMSEALSKFEQEDDLPTAAIKLLDADNVPSLSIADSSGVEGANLEFTVSLTGGAPQVPFTVKYNITGGTATMGTDFTLFDGSVGTTGSIAFDVNEMSKQIVIPLIDDNTDDTNETIIIEISNPTRGIELSSNTSATGTITEPGAISQQISLSEVPSSVTQGHNFTFKVSASETLTEDLPITLELRDGGHGIIKDISPGTYVNNGTSMLTIPQAGEQVVTVSTNKVSGHDNQNIMIKLTGAGATYLVASGRGGSDTVQSKDNSVVSPARPRLEFESFSEIPYSVNSPATGPSGETYVMFKIISSNIPSSDIQLKVLVDSTGFHYINGDDGEFTHTFKTTDEMESIFQIEVTDPLGGNNADGVISVELLDGDGFTLADADLHKTEANVVDEAPNTIAVLPIVSIESSAEMNGVTERGSFPFSVSAAENVGANLVVALDLPDGSSSGLTFAIEGASNNEVTIPNGMREYSGMIIVETTQNPGGVAANAPTSFTFGIMPDTTKYYVARREGTIDVTVKDKDDGDADTPLLTLIGPTSGSVTEGETATYMVTASHTPNKLPLTVSYFVADDQTIDFLATTQEGAKTVNITSGTTTTFDVITQEVTGTTTGTITVSIVDGAGYALGDAISVSTIVKDTVALPKISITSAATTTGVTEGYSFDFQIASDIPLPDSNPLVVSFIVTNGGTGARVDGTTVTIAGNSQTASGTVTGIGEVNSDTNVTVAVDDGQLYDLNTNSSIVVKVKDNDNADATRPSVKISSANYIGDGDAITFTVSASVAPTNPTDVDVVLTGRDFIVGALTATATLNGSNSATVSVTTVDGSAASGHGPIIATIAEGADYVRSDTATENFASVAVVADKPVISIANIPAVEKSHDNFMFALTSDITAVAGHPIRITGLTIDDASAQGPQYYDSHLPTDIQISDSNTTSITVTIGADDTTYQGWGQIDVDLANGDDYTADVNANARMVTITDHLTAPVSITVDAPASVVEDEDISVTLTASNTSVSEQTVAVDLEAADVTGTYLDYTNAPISITVPAGASDTEVVTIPTKEVAASSEGAISLTVQPGDGYNVPSSATPNVKVLSIEQLPSVTIVRTSPATIREGEDAIFTISATGTLAADLPITS